MITNFPHAFRSVGKLNPQNVFNHPQSVRWARGPVERLYSGQESSLAGVILGFEPRSSKRRMSGAGKGKSTAAISLEIGIL